MTNTPPRLDVTSAAPPAPTVRVLLADDHEPTLALTASALGGQYQIVGTVRNGADLLATASLLDPDVIVLDICMPKLNGLEAARELRRLQSRAKFVFLTVHEDADFARAAFESGGLGIRRQNAVRLGHPSRHPGRTWRIAVSFPRRCKWIGQADRAPLTC